MWTVAGIMFSRLSLWSESTEHNPFDFCTLLRLLVCRFHSPPRGQSLSAIPKPERASLYLDVTGCVPQSHSYAKAKGTLQQACRQPSWETLLLKSEDKVSWPGENRLLWGKNEALQYNRRGSVLAKLLDMYVTILQVTLPSVKPISWISVRSCVREHSHTHSLKQCSEEEYYIHVR